MESVAFLPLNSSPKTTKMEKRYKLCSVLRKGEFLFIGVMASVKMHGRCNKFSLLSQYSGGRDEQDFIDFLNEKCKTNRVSGGGISDEVIIYFS